MVAARELDRANETLDTVVDRPAADQAQLATRLLPASTAASSSASSGSSAAPSLRSEASAEVLRGEEVARARGMAAVIVLLTSAGLAFTPFMAIAAAVKIVLIATMLGPFMGVALWVLHRTRNEAGYTTNVYRVFGWSAAVASIPLQYGLGVFSPTPLVVTLGIYFFGQGMDRRNAIVIPAFAIVGYFVLAMLIALGVVADRAVLTGTEAPMLSKVFYAVMTPLVLTVTLWMARVSRRSLEDAVARTTRAMQIAVQREAQLVEAQQDLELALRAGAGHSGRYTGALAGAFELGPVVGRGAMGEVYAATDATSGARAAVKVLRPEALTREQAFERFVREGQVAGSLDVPNVVRIYEADVLDDGTPFIAMELLTGDDLAAVLRKRRRLKPAELVDLMHQVSRGLTAAHASGIVHRDLKPQNLFCHRADPGDAGTWKILDFGVSKISGSHGTLTQAGVVGTPGYMSPEQARGKDCDARADVFSLDAVLYRAATGRPPFSGSDLPQILFEIVYSTPPRPSGVVDSLPRDLDRVIAIALAKQPGDRFASAAELADAVAAALEDRLPHAVRARADAVIARAPWGQHHAPLPPAGEPTD